MSPRRLLRETSEYSNLYCSHEDLVSSFLTGEKIHFHFLQLAIKALIPPQFFRGEVQLSWKPYLKGTWKRNESQSHRHYQHFFVEQVINTDLEGSRFFDNASPCNWHVKLTFYIFRTGIPTHSKLLWNISAIHWQWPYKF